MASSKLQSSTVQMERRERNRGKKTEGQTRTVITVWSRTWAAGAAGVSEPTGENVQISQSLECLSTPMRMGVIMNK